ncbi:MAG: helix-turn-helix domain-containing protein [Bacteroidaceae bacterium]|nr:helix-turn-helix domain-containing protein [Bacteroidaceae bacterium]
MNKKDIIIELYKTGLTASEIAEQLGITKRYARKTTGTCANTSPQKLTESNYITAIKKGVESKKELAVHFGVSRMTMKRFEEKTGIKQKIARYLYIQGKTEKEITAILKTKTSGLNIHEAGTIPTIAGIKSELETVLGVLKEYTQIDDKAQSQFYTLKRICEKL